MHGAATNEAAPCVGEAGVKGPAAPSASLHEQHTCACLEGQRHDRTHARMCPAKTDPAAASPCQVLDNDASTLADNSVNEAGFLVVFIQKKPEPKAAPAPATAPGAGTSAAAPAAAPSAEPVSLGGMCHTEWAVVARA